MTSIHYALSLTAAMAVAGIAFGTTPAVAANSAMADCNKQWNDAKAANKAGAGTYQDFLKSCLKAAPAADAKAVTDTKAADTKAADMKAADKKAADKKAADMKAADMKAAEMKAAEMKAADAKTKADLKAKAKTDAAAADTAAATPDPMAKEKKECGKQWKTAKEAGTTGTQKKKDFVAECVAKMSPAADTVKAAAVAPADTMAKDDVVPPEPMADAKAVDAKATTADANGKVRTPGQLAMDKRIKECGGMWQIAKKDNTTGGLKWPQYWSACNKKLKAAAAN